MTDEEKARICAELNGGEPGPSGTDGVLNCQPSSSGTSTSTSGDQPMMDEAVNGHSSAATDKCVFSRLIFIV